MRETALGKLLLHRTRVLHRRWARAWEYSAPVGDRDLERTVAIAHHWRAADEPSAAIDACLRAADLARAGSAYSTWYGLLEDRAMRDDVRGKRLIAVFLFGIVLLNFPLLAVVDAGGTLFGLPLVFIYLFGAWAALIGLLRLIVADGRGRR